MIEPADHQAPVTAYFEDDAPFWRTVYEAEGVFSAHPESWMGFSSARVQGCSRSGAGLG